MGLQLLRGRELKPPLREVRGTGTHLQEATQVTNIGAAKTALRFPVNPDTQSLLSALLSRHDPAEWNDWRWQMRTRIRTLDELARIFTLSEDEHAAVAQPQGLAAGRHHALLRQPDGPGRCRPSRCAAPTS